MMIKKKLYDFKTFPSLEMFKENNNYTANIYSEIQFKILPFFNICSMRF